MVIIMTLLLLKMTLLLLKMSKTKIREIFNCLERSGEVIHFS